MLRPMGEAECLMPLPREKMTFGDTSYTKPEYQPLSKPHTRTNARYIQELVRKYAASDGGTVTLYP